MPRYKCASGCYNKHDARELGLAAAVVWNDIIDRAEHFDEEKIWYDQGMASERLGIPQQTISRCLKTLEEANRITTEGGYRPRSSVRTTWVTVSKDYLDDNLITQNGYSKVTQNGYSILNDTEENETESQVTQTQVKMKPEALYARVHSFFKGPNEMRKQKIEAIKKLQEEYELSDDTIINGMKAISENKTIKFENGDEFTFTLTHLLLRSELEKTATLLVRKAEETANKKPVNDKLKTFVKITDM